MIAVIETGGKQYIVSPGKKIEVEKLSGQVGDKFDFDKVLLLENNGKLEVGKPYLSAKVSAEIVAQNRRPKITVFKYHSKTRYRKNKGHRQLVTVVKVV